MPVPLLESGMLILLRFKGLVGRSGLTFRFEVDRGYSPLAPHDTVELDGRLIAAIYRARDGFYVVYWIIDPTHYFFYMAEGVPEDAELIPRTPDGYYACPMCWGPVDLVDEETARCPFNGTIGRELIEWVPFYEFKPFNWNRVLRGRPPRRVDEVWDFWSRITAENVLEVLRQFLSAAGVEASYLWALEKGPYIRGLWRRTATMRGVMLAVVEGAVVDRSAEPPDTIVDYGVFVYMVELGLKATGETRVRALAKVSDEVTPEGYRYLAERVRRGELGVGPHVFERLSRDRGSPQVQGLIKDVSRALAGLEEKLGGLPYWALVEDKYERTWRKLSGLRPPEWASAGVYFELSSRGIVTAYPVRGSVDGEDFYFCPAWRPVARFTPVLHEMAMVPVGSVVTKDKKVVRVRPRSTPESVYVFLETPKTHGTLVVLEEPPKRRTELIMN